MCMRRNVLACAPALILALILALSSACPDGTPTCATYCASVTANCFYGGAAQYQDEATCVAFCEAGTLAWAVGTADKAGAAANTLGCRQFHAGAADNDDHCLHAGPTGGGVCGAYCDVYCDAAMANCTAGNALYADRDSCLAACGNLPANGVVNAADGNSVQCRLFHLGAAKADAAGHCAHGGPTGANVCGTWCEVYCDTMSMTCPDEQPGGAACEAACSAFPASGAIGAAEGDSVQCRLYHASAAANDAHCDHASAESTAGTCQ